MASRPLIDARRAGSLEAQRARARLGLLDARRVDVFSVIEGLGVWLMFQPLDRLYGFYRRMGNVAGIAVNAHHPASLQRYTAAHELGHHLLGHGFSLDEVHAIDGAAGVEESRDFDEALAARSPRLVGNTLEEAAAQSFAATFLMPIQAVNRALVEAGFDRDRPDVDAEDVYRLSLEFGTSYEATITQLAVLEKITWARAKSLRLPPIKIKTGIAGRRPDDSRADVWVIEDTGGDHDLPLRVADEMIVRLTEVPSSGCAWELDNPASLGPLQVVDQAIAAVDEDDRVFGGTAVRELYLRAVEPGRAEVRFSLRRPWQAGTPLQSLTVHVDVADGPTGDAPWGLIRSQQLLRASA